MLRRKSTCLQQYPSSQPLPAKVRKASKAETNRKWSSSLDCDKSFKRLNYQSSQKSIPSTSKRSQVIITELLEKENDLTVEVDLTNACDPGCILIIYLPFIITRDLTESIKQPLLFKVEKEQFLLFGFDLPFTDFFDERANFFDVKIGKFDLTGQIIATGETPLDLSNCLRKNVKLNQNWQKCRKMVGNAKLKRDLIHNPKSNRRQIIRETVMDEKDLETLISHLKDKNDDNEYEIEDDAQSEMEDGFFTTQPLQEKERKMESLRANLVDKNISEKTKVDCSCSSSTSKEVIFTRMETKKSQINERKKLLSQLDINGIILSDLIDFVCDLHLVSMDKEDHIQSRMQTIPAEDKTFKIKQKNMIVLEGLVPLKLDKYEYALKKSKRNNPFSLTYHLIRISFPEVYFKNIVLGKKSYNEDELEKYNESDNEKLPLPFIWGFDDPFDEPMKGHFDSNLGLNRVRAFIEHILRKSNILQYEEDLENKIRARIVKVLCEMNSFNRKRSSTKDLSQDEMSEKESDSDLVWDSSCFL